MSASEKLKFAISETETMQRRLVANCATVLDDIAIAAANCLRNGGKLLFAGNGGSAAECQHIATEFTVRLSAQRDRKALAAISLTTDTSLLTACSNDYGFERVFARQVEALLRPGDALFLLSTSGTSPNIIHAAKSARERKGIVVIFAGDAQSPLDEFANFALHVPSPSGQRVQEAHLLCGHLLVELVEDQLLT